MHRSTFARLGLFAVTLIASVFFASSAMAGWVPWPGCVDPAGAGASAFGTIPSGGDFDLSGNRCDQICRDATRACAKSARTGLACNKGVIQAWLASERRRCQDISDSAARRSCLDDVKTWQGEVRSDLSSSRSDARTTCGDARDDCFFDCDNPPA